MAVETHIYDRQFFRNTKKLESASAKAAVEILIKYFHPQSVIDIGCGAGIYLKEFAAKDIKIIGYDGSPAAAEESLVGNKVLIHDLCQPLNLEKKFDLCLCFEVAEHLEENCAPTLLETLAKLADTLVFTAATPGQGPRSIGHINEQPHEYWIEKLRNKNFLLDENLTKKIRQEMEERGVVWWITKNLLVFRKKL